jgi:hypothetical protein
MTILLPISTEVREAKQKHRRTAVLIQNGEFIARGNAR